MQPVHYFQRFSKKEDVDTNNTLLLLKRIQQHDSSLFQYILQAMLSNDDLRVGAMLTEQETTRNSIADGMIRQDSFHVILETKRSASFSEDQLRRHLTAFSGAREALQVLLLLGKEEPANFDAVNGMVEHFNKEEQKSVRLVWTTFANLVDACRTFVPEHEREMIDMVDDYEDFCGGEGLLASNDATFLVVGCSRSLDDNQALKIYFDPKKPHRPAKYIGYYKDKAVRAIGRVDCVARAERVRGSLTINGRTNVTANQRQRILEAMDRAPAHGWNIDEGHTFFLSEEVENTCFLKTTKYPLWNWRYFDLRKVLKLSSKDKIPNLKKLANALRNESW